MPRHTHPERSARNISQNRQLPRARQSARVPSSCPEDRFNPKDCVSSIVRNVGSNSLKAMRAKIQCNDYYLPEPQPRIEVMARDLVQQALNLHPGWREHNLFAEFLNLPQIDIQRAEKPVVTHVVKTETEEATGNLVQKIFVRDPAIKRCDGYYPLLLTEVDAGI